MAKVENKKKILSLTGKHIYKHIYVNVFLDFPCGICFFLWRTETPILLCFFHARYIHKKIKMKFSITALALTAAAANALDATPKQVAELNAVLQDLKSNFNDYINLATDPSSGFSLADMPAGLIDLGMAIGTATDDSYTSMYTGVDFAGVDKLVTMVPWYSSRLLPLINELYTAPASSSAAAPATSAPATSAPAPAASSAAPAASSSYAPAPLANSTTALAANGTTTHTTTHLSTATETVCDEVCHASKSAAAISAHSAFVNGTTTQTTTHLSTATETVCDEECHKSKAALATAYSNATVTSTYCPESSAFLNGTVTKTNLHTTTSTVCETCTEQHTTTSTVCETCVEQHTAATQKPAPAAPAAQASGKPAAPASGNQTTMTTSTIKVSVTSAKPSVQAAPSSTPAVQHQTANGAAKAVAGMGAGALAAVALLL